MTTTFEERLSVAVSLREGGSNSEALGLLLELVAERPDDPEANLQCAWAHDKLGLETSAVPFYEKAIEAGLSGTGLHDALLGLGSTYRALGRYDDALETLTVAVETYPDDNALAVFRSMALYNSGRPKDACETLLRVILATTHDESITRYARAIAQYASDLDRTWR